VAIGHAFTHDQHIHRKMCHRRPGRPTSFHWCGTSITSVPGPIWRRFRA
jgi:hypothetical protein